MTHRSRGAIHVVLAAVATIGTAAPAASAQEPTTPPDVVLIVTDDQRWDTLWAMPVVQKELVGRGVSFSNAFVVNPICCPSRASILTGNYSHTTQVYRQAPPFGRYEWFDDTSTLATWLDAAGYTTGLFGKYLDGYQHAALTGVVPPGWDRWVAFVHSGYYGYQLTVDGAIRAHGFAAADYSTEVLAGEAVDFIERTEGPLFLELAPAAPHAPAIPAPVDEGAFSGLEPARPASFDEEDVADKPAWVEALPRLSPSDRAAVDALRREQYRSLLSVDRAVADVLDALDRTGRLENTIVVLTSDNGFQLGEHRWVRKEAPYEESIRVPLVVRWDAAGWTTPVTHGALALNIDLAPTIAEATGLRVEADGRSLLPVFDERMAGWRRDFLIEHLEHETPVPTYCAVRTEGAKYVRYSTGEEELYDLAADPFELENLAGEPARSVELAALRARLRALCVPAPPGFDRGGPRRIAAALALLVGLIAIETFSTRRRRQR
ncbi:MAG: sulfatase family protein [Actinomycetota bacterium]